MFVLESSVFWIPRALVWRLVAPLSRVLEEITQTLDYCWGYESKTPIGGKINMESSNYMVFRRIGGPLGEFISSRVL